MTNEDKVETTDLGIRSSENEDESSIGEGDDDSNANPTNQRAQAALTEKQTLARKETRVVGRLRIYFLLFLVITAGLVAWGTFSYTRNVEVEDFESRFESIAGSVSESFHNAVEHKLGALDAMSVTITSHALQSGESFPMVTLPDFETRGSNTRILADGVYIFWLPLVKDDQRTAWENYAAQRYTHLYASFQKDVMLRTLQDQSFGLGGDARRLGMEQESIRSLQGDAFQTYVPTIWNFQVGSEVCKRE